MSLLIRKRVGDYTEPVRVSRRYMNEHQDEFPFYFTKTEYSAIIVDVTFNKKHAVFILPSNSSYKSILHYLNDQNEIGSHDHNIFVNNILVYPVMGDVGFRRIDTKALTVFNTRIRDNVDLLDPAFLETATKMFVEIEDIEIGKSK